MWECHFARKVTWEKEFWFIFSFPKNAEESNPCNENGGVDPLKTNEKVLQVTNKNQQTQSLV